MNEKEYEPKTHSFVFEGKNIGLKVFYQKDMTDPHEVPWCDIFLKGKYELGFRCNPTKDYSKEYDFKKLEEKAKTTILKLNELPF